MRWTPKAEAAVKKVPFFVRKKVKARVEKKALQAGKPVVELASGLPKYSKRRILRDWYEKKTK